MQILKLKKPEQILVQIQEYFKKNEEAQFIHRLHTILLKIDNETHTCESIGKLLGHSNKTISTWINKLNENSNIEDLRSKPKSGRIPKLTEVQLSEIKIVLQKSPEQSGITSNLWDGKSLSYYISITYGVEIGARQCQRLFKKLGFSLKRPRPAVAKSDPLKKEAFKKKE